MQRKTKGIITILLGVGLIVILATFSSNYHLKRGIMGNIISMEIVFQKGEYKTDAGRLFSGHYEGRFAVPYKYFFAVGIILIVIGTGLVLLQQPAAENNLASAESLSSAAQQSAVPSAPQPIKKLSTIPFVIYSLAAFANFATESAQGKIHISNLESFLYSMAYTLGVTLIPLIAIIAYWITRRDWVKNASLIISALWIIVVLFAYMDWSTYRLRDSQSNNSNRASAALDIDDPFKASSVAADSSRDPGRDAYLQKLDALIGDGTSSLRLQTVRDPSFVTFLSLNDKSTGRVLKDIAEEADRNHDAVLMAEVYKAFFTWKLNSPRQ